MMLRRNPFLPILVLGTLLGAAVAAEAGDRYRRSHGYDLYEGPSVLALDAAEVSAAAAKLRKKSRRGTADELPGIVVDVVDPNGNPAPGVQVEVMARIGKRRKKDREDFWLVGATDANGRVAVRRDPLPGLRWFRVRLRWSGGYRAVSAYFEPEGDGWKMARAPYLNVLEDRDEGACWSLFRLEPAGSGEDLHLELRQPETMLACDEVVYGVERKSRTFADVGQIGRRELNEGDKNMFGPEYEAEIGKEAAKQVDQQFEVLHDARIEGYLQGMLDRIVAASDAPAAEAKPVVLHSESVNAFVTGGGNVYVFTGLIAAAESEAQLAGVLGHEMAHLLARHVTEGMTRQIKTQLGVTLGALAVGAAADLGDDEQRALMMGGLLSAGLVGMRYDRRAETEADLLGMQYLWKAGYDPEGIAEFFRVLESESGPSGPGWLSTHPTHETRVRNGVHWSRTFLPEEERYLVSTEEFERIQEYVRSLPKPGKDGAAQGKGLMELVEESPSYQRYMSSQLEGLLMEPAPQR